MQNQLNKIFLGCLLLLWAVVSWHYLSWFFGHLTLHFDLLHVLILIGILFFWFNNRKASIHLAPQFYRNIPALLLGLLSLLALAFFKVQSPIRLFGFVASLFLGYSILGLAMSANRWKKNLLPFTLLVMTLPFGRHLDVFVGYPLRMLSVEAAHSLLKPIMPNITSVSSLLIVENRASQIDMDCSGLRGMWVGLLLYFVISWIENTKINFRWMVGMVGLAAFLVLGNLVRILLLSLIHLYWQESLLDPWVHHSTSVFFLVTGIGFCWWYLRHHVNKRSVMEIKDPHFIRNPLALQLGACLLLFIMLFLPTFAQTTEIKNQPNILSKMQELDWQPTELGAAEREVYRREGVQGFKFLKGPNQLILIMNGDWRSQHKPELCYELSGLPLVGMSTLLLNKNFPVKELKFKERKERAYFWFQSGEEVTDDFAVKVWKQLKAERGQWTLVSLLNKNGEMPKQDIRAIHQLLKQSIN